MQLKRSFYNIAARYGSQFDNSGRSLSEVLRCITIAHECMKSIGLDHNIYGVPASPMSHSTMFCLYMVYILPVLLYGSEMWTMTKGFGMGD